MAIEGVVHCDGSDCEVHAHMGADTVEAERLPLGFVKVSYYLGNGQTDEEQFCSNDCAMKKMAELPPMERIEWGDHE